MQPDAGDNAHCNIEGQHGRAAVAKEWEGQTDDRHNAQTHADIDDNLEHQGACNAHADHSVEILSLIHI